MCTCSVRIVIILTLAKIFSTIIHPIVQQNHRFKCICLAVDEMQTITVGTEAWVLTGDPWDRHQTVWSGPEGQQVACVRQVLTRLLAPAANRKQLPPPLVGVLSICVCLNAALSEGTLNKSSTTLVWEGEIVAWGFFCLRAVLNQTYRI